MVNHISMETSKKMKYQDLVIIKMLLIKNKFTMGAGKKETIMVLEFYKKVILKIHNLHGPTQVILREEGSTVSELQYFPIKRKVNLKVIFGIVDNMVWADILKTQEKQHLDAARFTHCGKDLIDKLNFMKIGKQISLIMALLIIDMNFNQPQILKESLKMRI